MCIKISALAKMKNTSLTYLVLIVLNMCCMGSQAQTVGLFYNNAGTANGYVLFAPGQSDTTYLIDKCGKRVHAWASDFHPGLSVYLQEDGTLLRCSNVGNNQFGAGGQGGLLEERDWDSNLLWSYLISDNSQCQHHDAIRLPNGNVLAIVWENHTFFDAQANGRISLGSKMWSEKIVEVQPVGTNSGVIVWQWRAWDHLVQQADTAKLNYGVVADHPELLDINMGMLDGSNADWLHFNSLDYNAALDQIMVSSHAVSEVYIIDHSTTMEEAASHSGGNAGRGGDLMYRWGNPQNYGRGTAADQKFYSQHNLHWITADGEVMLFNNGVGRPGTDYSTVETFKLPAMVNNNYPIANGTAFGPVEQDWIYTATPPLSLFSVVQGGAQRLYNGNTLICNGVGGIFTEIDSSGNLLWKYINPVSKNSILTQGDVPFINDCFRATYLPSYYPGLSGHSLTPGLPIELNPLSYSCENFPTAIATTGSDDGNFYLYPNPFGQQFTLHFGKTLQQGVLQVHDLAGRLCYENRNLNARANEDVSIELPVQVHGMFIITLQDAKGTLCWKNIAIAQ